MTEVEQQLRNTLEHYAHHTEVSVDALEVMGSRRRRRALILRAGGLVAAAAAAVALVAIVGVLPRPADTVIEPVTGGGSQDTASTDGDRSEQDTAPGASSDHALVQQTVEQLIAANRAAPERPAPADGEVLVDRTYAVWAATTVGGDTVTHELELQVNDTLHGSAGRDPISKRARIATRQPTADGGELRAWAEGRLAGIDVDELLATDGGFELTGWDPAPFVQQAEEESRGTVEPAPGATERPDQAHAFIAAADALREGLRPAQRIRVLEAIGRIDDRFTEHRGQMRDLLGRPGVAIAGYDPTNDRYQVLIFDRETGDLLGEFGHDGDVESAGLPISGYTARETFIRAVDQR